VRGAFVASILVGLIDTIGRGFLPDALKAVLSPAAAATVAPALSSMLIYLIMAVVLVLRPEGLFPAANR
jgi:branched-chain amino acid transport system permease protein